MNAFLVVLIAHTTGLAFMLMLVGFAREPFPGWTSMAWGAVAGAVGGIGLAAFYKSLAVGTMGINASLSCVITAIQLPHGRAAESASDGRVRTRSGEYLGD